MIFKYEIYDHNGRLLREERGFHSESEAEHWAVQYARSRNCHKCSVRTVRETAPDHQKKVIFA